jgi:hypothetical protein
MWGESKILPSFAGLDSRGGCPHAFYAIIYNTQFPATQDS